MKLYVVVLNKFEALEVSSNKKAAERWRKQFIIDQLIDETPHMQDINVMKKLQESSSTSLKKRSVNYLVDLYNKGFRKKAITDLSIVMVDTNTKLFKMINAELESLLENVKEDLYFKSKSTKQQKVEMRQDAHERRNAAASIVALIKRRG